MSMSAFEVLGPVMVGPSSSHTAGALRIARVARLLAPQPLERVEFVLYNSFSKTHAGHGTDRALVAGILGLPTDDERVRDSFNLAREAGLSFQIIEGGDNGALHPNTVLIRMVPQAGAPVEIAGESVGGGRIRISSIDGVAVSIAGELPTVFVAHRDKPGVLAALTGALSARGLNIATMPRAGSQTNPSRLPRAIDAASRHWRTVPPMSSTSALAAMAAAAPTSAWHPPSAPATVALSEMSAPIAAAFHNARMRALCPAPIVSP